MPGSLEDRDEEDRVEGGVETAVETGDEPLDTGRLALDDGDDRLPWLESDDDFEEYTSADSGRILGLVLLGLVSLTAIVGSIWWVTHRNADSVLVADGSTIAAPDKPYKEAPGNPGGKTFDGTGDTSFAVSVGQNRPARLGHTGSGPKPAADLGPKPGQLGASKASAPPAALASEASGVAVQVGAFSTQASAEAAWSRLSQQHSMLSGLRHRVVEGRADIGTVYRLQALAGDTGAANALCGRLKTAGLACQVKN